MAGAGTGSGTDGGGSSSGGSEATTSPPSSQGKAGGGTPFEYFGWVYHMGVNSVGHDYCHLRFLYLKGKHVHMYMRDPHEDPSAKAIRKGVVSNALMVEELGRKKVNHGDGDVYVLRIYSRLDETKKGEIACATAGEAQKWMEAFDQAKQQADFELSQGSSQTRLNNENEFNLEGHRSRMRPYAADGLKKLIRIGKGPEKLLRRSYYLRNKVSSVDRFEGDGPDAIEAHEWKCVRTVNGIRIFEDAARQKSSKGILVKAVAVLDANLDSVFEVVCNLDRGQRYQWDVLTGDVELLDSVNGHYDVIYGTFDTNCVTRWWHSKIDFVFSRQWFRAQDGGAYTILQLPANHKKRPPRHGYKRVEINPSSWEIRSLNLLPHPSLHKCLVTHTLEVCFSGWEQWKGYCNSKFEKSIPYALLCQVAGLREYFAANPKFAIDYPSTVIHSKVYNVSSTSDEFEDTDLKDEFYDAVGNEEQLDDDDSDEDTDLLKDAKVRLKNVSWAIASLALRKSSSLVANTELDTSVSPVQVDWSQFHGSMRQGVDASAMDCWTAPSGQGFMIRGKTYLEDYSKVPGGDPLLKLLAVDWFRSDSKIDMIALHPSCIVQSEAARKLPFILVINLQIPARPNYSLVLYYGVTRPINKGSLLSRFVNGTDGFRDERFKLIPNVVEGYWMVKRAVGSKACLLGKAVTCKYLQRNNFLEIDVDIGSSSVARSIIGLVLGYVTSIVVDLAILIEAKDERELPEYVLGSVRLNRLKPESAVPF